VFVSIEGTSIAERRHTTSNKREVTMGQQHPHNRIAVKSRCTDCGRELGSFEFDRREAAAQEVEAQGAGTLPNREAMSLVNANLAIPINVALAANVLSDGAIAAAAATQNTPIDQGMLNNPPTGGE
jgi:hypothetical protein